MLSFQIQYFYDLYSEKFSNFSKWTIFLFLQTSSPLLQKPHFLPMYSYQLPLPQRPFHHNPLLSLSVMKSSSFYRRSKLAKRRWSRPDHLSLPIWSPMRFLHNFVCVAKRINRSPWIGKRRQKMSAESWKVNVNPPAPSPNSQEAIPPFQCFHLWRISTRVLPGLCNNHSFSCSSHHLHLPHVPRVSWLLFLRSAEWLCDVVLGNTLHNLTIFL